MANKLLRVGFDLDGVLLYNPARISRPIISIVKKLLFKKKGLRFYSPQTTWEKQFWKLFHRSSIFIAPGLDEIKTMIKQKKIKAYIITARYSFLKQDLEKWLKKIDVDHYFSGVFYNEKDEQPHLFKERMIKKLKLDMFVEDNWDIVNYLLTKSRSPSGQKIYWIYNIFDRNIKYKYKLSSLKNFIKSISQ